MWNIEMFKKKIMGLKKSLSFKLYIQMINSCGSIAIN